MKDTPSHKNSNKNLIKSWKSEHGISPSYRDSFRTHREPRPSQSEICLERHLTRGDPIRVNPGTCQDLLGRDILSFPLTSTLKDAGPRLLPVILFMLSLKMKPSCGRAEPTDRLDSLATEFLIKLFLKLYNPWSSRFIKPIHSLLWLKPSWVGLSVILNQIALVLLT